MNNIRNFCIIAHIDHGKSTLADRLIEVTQTVSDREMQDQLLDTMDIERERGITIKLQPVTMNYTADDGNEYILNLIDTPGHVDFHYEVSRSLAAVEGAILLVDASQGIQAQTLANLYLAIEQDLKIIPVLNKIDLPAADVPKVTQEVISLLGCDESEILHTSGKTGEGVPELLAEIVKRVPAPTEPETNDFRALIFDSVYDEYKGVISYVRVFDGELAVGEKARFMATKADSEVLDLGVLAPTMQKRKKLRAGEIGYIITGIKEIQKCRVGDTITQTKQADSAQSLGGYKEVNPMVYAGIFCNEGSEYERLRAAIGKLKLNDAALVYEPEHSNALGFGFRCGFLGMLHLEIFQERLRREYNLELVVTVPSVAYNVTVDGSLQKIGHIKKENIIDESTIVVTSAADFLDPSKIKHIEEPVMSVDIVAPQEYIGAIMGLVQEKRGEYRNTEYLNQAAGDNRVILHYYMPLATLIVDFYDKLKSVTSGYASLNYDFHGYQQVEVVKLDVLVANDPVESLAMIVYKDEAHSIGKKIVKSLKEVIPRQLFEIKLQAAIGAKVVASERISAMRKDVTAKLYGGDYSRKQKLLKKQKEGKKRMRAHGKVDIPTDAFLKILRK